MVKSYDSLDMILRRRLMSIELYAVCWKILRRRLKILKNQGIWLLIFSSKVNSANDAAQGIVAESPQESRRATRTCSGKPDPPEGGCAPVEIGIRGLGLGVWSVYGQLVNGQ